MQSARNVRRAEAGAAAAHPAATVRGAGELLRALADAGAGARSLPAFQQAGLVRSKKEAKKVARILDQAIEALTSRRYKAAEELLEKGIAQLEAPNARLWCYRLVAATKAANYDYVLDNYPRIRALVSTDAEVGMVDRAWLDCLMAAEYFEEALQVAERLAVPGTGAFSSVQTVIGVIHARLGDLEKAIAIQEAILEAEPSHVLARWHLSLHQLEAGVLPAAFDNYEARWDWLDFPSERRIFDIPRWKGEDLKGRRILVWREQGIGDELRFSGILPDLVAAGAEVTFECSRKLVPLFSRAFPEIVVCAERSALKRPPDDYGSFDFQIPVGSLARRFRPTVAEMQARCRPWLRRDPEAEMRVRSAMGAAPFQPVIGLSWRSSLRNLKRNHHYLNAEYLAALRLLGKSSFISLQYDDCRSEVQSMRELGLPIVYFSDIDQMNDLVSASHLAGACDLVITAGTATAELSAGLGVPTIMFGPKQSHIQLGTDGIPWHPASRYLTKSADDPMGVAKAILFGWNDIAAWAAKAGNSGRQIDWRLSFPGA